MPSLLNSNVPCKMFLAPSFACIQVDAFLRAAGEGNERAVVHFLDSGGDVNAKTKTGTR